MSFPQNSLYLVTDRDLSFNRPLSYIVEAAIDGGVTVVQYREKNFQYNLDLKEVEQLRNICYNNNVIFLINDRVDLALVVDADGVHLGQSDMPVAAARNILGNDKIIGWSIETLSDLENFNASDSLKSSIDYLALSPIYPTPTKQDTIGAWGLEGIEIVRSATNLPLVGIGGINSSNMGAIIEAGIDSIAVVSAICSADDPKLASEKLKIIMEESSNKRIV
ncbi:MAG: thiamine phosphate synthase [Leptospira sp.]|nr:thiamine phosphate synthase [Leptospira sp.]